MNFALLGDDLAVLPLVQAIKDHPNTTSRMRPLPRHCKRS